MWRESTFAADKLRGRMPRDLWKYCGNFKADYLSGDYSRGMSEHTSTFEQLRGEQLSAVTFVQDYLQLWFDGPGLNVTNPLTVQAGQLSVTSWQPGFRDAICSQIAKIVAAVDCREGEAFVIRFEDGSHLSISLREHDYTTPEAIYGHGFRDNVSFVV